MANMNENTNQHDVLNPMKHTMPNDDRLHLLGAGSTYCDVNDVIGDDGSNLKTAKYVALHINIHSLPSKFDQLKHIICLLKEQNIIVHFILLCETFLVDANADRYNIPGYSMIHESRNSLTLGGVAMYISNKFNFKPRPDLCINIEGEFECVAAEIEAKHSERNLIIGEIYRVPNTPERLSIARYESVMTHFCNTNCDILVGTDQNLDYMKTDTNNNVSDLLDVFFTLGTLPSVITPTRVTPSSATLIDNIYVKCDKYENITSRTLLTDISDHFPILTGIGRCENMSKKHKQPITFMMRKLGAAEVSNIGESMQSTDWEQKLCYDDVNQCYEEFIAHFTSIMDTHAPLKQKKTSHLIKVFESLG